MKLLLTIIAVALPVLGLLHYIYSHDKIKPEPIRMFFLTFLAGIAGGVLSFLFGRYIGTIDIYTTHPGNSKDVTYYKGLLQEYTRDLLMVMREDFIEEITGHHIKNKAFEEY